MWIAGNAAERRGELKFLVEKRAFAALGYCAAEMLQTMM
jgi:hypothetical protein